MNEEEYEELARWLPCHPGRWVAWPEPFGTRAEADALFESLRDGGLESFKVDSAALRWRIDEFKSIVDGLLAYTVADRRNGTRGHVKDERSGVKGACRPSDAAWLLEQAKAQGITDTKPLHVAEYRQENDK